jgi:UDP-N-acetylmuramoylalanine--D-glutamate ligase
MDLRKKFIPGKRAVVLGMGISGRAMVAFLHSEGLLVSVSDGRQFEELSKGDQDYLLQHKIAFEGGGHSEEFLDQADFIAISPGVPTDLPLLETLRQRGIPILGELAIAAPYLTEQVVAVTGTNGKTTVTALIGELLTASGKDVFVGGNIGTPLLNYLLSEQQADVLVLELSSFQLESAGTFRPHVGVLLNVTPDHLDRHGSMVAYSAAKMKLFAMQKETDLAILCSDDAMCEQIAPLLITQKVQLYGTRDIGNAASGSKDLLRVAADGAEQEYSLQGTRMYSYTGFLNSCAALLAASHMGCKKTDMERGLQAFVPASHRLQHVRDVNGVQYFNDSKATNTGAVLSALSSFSGNVILIAGGRDKGEQYGVLKNAALSKLKGLVLMGEATEKIAAALGDDILTMRATSMEEAVRIAEEQALPGDVVLLAPACASFDMFDSYVHRGEVFMEAVHNLPDGTSRRAA